ncbi:MAG: hypothetical protein C5B59_00230 [Bacteroidetes bacterium]|nr:MAG: hypothetical protein C5B59_00230 [Bacteroidota bacterium]
MGLLATFELVNHRGHDACRAHKHGRDHGFRDHHDHHLDHRSGHHYHDNNHYWDVDIRNSFCISNTWQSESRDAGKVRVH